MNSNRKKLTVFFLSFLVVALLGLAIYIVTALLQREASLTNVTFRYNPVAGAEVVLYKGAKKDLIEPQVQGNPEPVTNGETLRLEDWPYVLIVRGEGIEETKQVIYPQQASQTVTATVAKRTALLESDLERSRNDLLSVIEAIDPKLSDNYTIEKLQLHGDGSWATAQLSYIGSNKMLRDPLQVILQRTGSTWSRAAGPALTIHRSSALQDAPQSVFWSVIPDPVAAS